MLQTSKGSEFQSATVFNYFISIIYFSFCNNSFVLCIKVCHTGKKMFGNIIIGVKILLSQ